MIFPICPHQDLTPPDTEGQSICSNCGATIQRQLTEAAFFRTYEHVKRQGHHSMNCVDTPDGWCCAADCPSVRRGT